MRRLSPGVDTDFFRPHCGGAGVRERWGIGADTPVVCCVGRLVSRKGQDTLIRAWPSVLEELPDARLLLVGDGPDRSRLRRMAAPLGDSVLLTGKVPWEEVPAHTEAGDLFAMPCRTRHGGLEVEAFGIVFLEAAACGLPVLVGGSGGAAETVVDSVTGHVVDPHDPTALARRVVSVLGDPEGARRMGAAGRERVEREWTWQWATESLRRLLADPPHAPGG